MCSSSLDYDFVKDTDSFELGFLCIPQEASPKLLLNGRTNETLASKRS